MANQDYVSRPPAKKTKYKRAPKKTVQKNNTLTFKAKIISILFVLLISAFTYGLWVLKTDPITKTPLPLAVEEVNKSKTSNNNKTLPKPPKEKWTYVEDLTTKEVEVGQYEVQERGPYKMQCGSFRTQNQAQTLKAQIAFSGLEAQIKAVKGDSGVWHKVFLGPYARKRLAEEDKNKLKRNNINYCQIWLWK
jgi:cell division protein FtsN